MTMGKAFYAIAGAGLILALNFGGVDRARAQTSPEAFGRQCNAPRDIQAIFARANSELRQSGEP